MKQEVKTVIVDENEIAHKVVILGDSGVGKSSIINRFINDKFFPNCGSTLAGCFSKKGIYYEEYKETVVLNIWDTAGQEKYRSLNKMFYQDAECIILVYDITNKDTLTELKNYWVDEIQTFIGNEDVIIFLVGNKIDETEYRDIPKDTACAWAEKINADYSETSAKTGEGINELFHNIGKYFIGNKDLSLKNKKRSFLSKNGDNDIKETKGGCCG